MKRFVICICCLLLTFKVCAQEQDQSTISDNIINSYFTEVKSSAVIYSGKEEPNYKFPIMNHPYLDTDRFRYGKISFDGKEYPNVLFRLNQEIGELIVLSANSRFSVIVPKNRVDYATIDSAYIYYLDSKSAADVLLPEGYYVRLYNGDNKVVKREVFYLLSSINNAYNVEYSYQKSIKIYIQKDGSYHPVKNKRSVLNFFSSKKKDLKKFIRQSGLSFSKNPDEAIVAVAKYYDELNK